MKKLNLAVLLVSALPMLWAIDSGAQTAKTTKYKYDALGRLTFVEDSVNGNRDYDYDRAGNRTNVVAGTASDTASDPPASPPAPPTFLYSWLVTVSPCKWKANWFGVPGATNYMFAGTTGSPVSLTAVNTELTCTAPNPESNKPAWVQACNAAGCSAKSYFSY